MHSTLWGPGMWQLMFACAWSAKPEDADAVRALLLDQIPYLLPCGTCRENFSKHLAKVNRRAQGAPRADEYVYARAKTSAARSPDHAFRWLWYLKDEVNKLTGHPSLPYAELVDRHVLHGAHLDEVVVADTLVLVALSARKLERDDLFVTFCHTLARLLPVPLDAALRQYLTATERPVVNAALRCARHVRIQNGRPPLVMAHYRTVAS